MSTDFTLIELKENISNCRVCAPMLSHQPNPVVRASQRAKLLIIGQAPGRKVHETGIPWNDPSGDLLREWLGLAKDQFYDQNQIAIMPMGFCYPGKGKSGDLPPRKECAPLWHKPMLNLLPALKLTLLVGSYAQKYYLEEFRKDSMANNLKLWNMKKGNQIPLPHPSPRNRLWLKTNHWFEKDQLPIIRHRVQEVLNT